MNVILSYQIPDLCAQKGDDLVDGLSKVSTSNQVVKVDLKAAERRINVENSHLLIFFEESHFIFMIVCCQSGVWLIWQVRERLVI